MPEYSFMDIVDRGTNVNQQLIEHLIRVQEATFGRNNITVTVLNWSFVNAKPNNITVFARWRN